MPFTLNNLNQRYEDVKLNSSACLVLDNHICLLRNWLGPFHIITDQVSKIYFTNSIFIVKNDSLYRYNNSLVEIERLEHIPENIFNTQYGLIYVFEKNTKFKNSTLDCVIIGIVEDHDELLLYSSSRVYLQSQTLKEIVSSKNILLVKFHHDLILVINTESISYYKQNTIINSIKLKIESILCCNSDYFISINEKNVFIFYFETQQLRQINLSFIPKLSTWNDTLLCVQHDDLYVYEIEMSDFTIKSTSCLGVSLISVHPYFENFIGIGEQIFDISKYNLRYLYCSPNSIRQIDQNTILFNDKRINTKQIKSVHVDEHIFVYSDDLEVYDYNGKQIDSIKTTNLFSISYPLVYIGNTQNIVAYNILTKDRKQYDIKHLQFDIKQKICCVLNDKFTIYNNFIIEQHLDMKNVCYFGLSHSGEYLAVYTERLLIFNTNTFDSYTLEVPLKSFLWDQRYNAFLIDSSLYLVFDGLYSVHRFQSSVSHLCLPNYTTDKVESLQMFQYNTSVLNCNIMDVYQLKQCSQPELKTALIIFLILNHNNKYYCKFKLGLNGNDEDLLLQLDYDTRPPEAEVDKVTFYKNCNHSLIYNILEEDDYEELAEEVNRKELFYIIGEFNEVNKKYEKAMEYYQKSGSNLFKMNLFLNKNPNPIEPIDFYHLACHVDDFKEKIRYYLKAKCPHHALELAIQNNYDVYDTSLQTDKNGMLKAAKYLQNTDPEKAKLLLNKLDIPKDIQEESPKRKQRDPILDLLESKSYKEALKQIITKDIKITPEYHASLMNSDINLGEIYFRMKYFDYAIEYYLKRKDYHQIIRIYEEQTKSAIQISDYEHAQELMQIQYKLMTKLKMDASALKRDMDMLHVFIKGSKLPNNERNQVMEALLKKNTIIKKQDIMKNLQSESQK
eukprot:NODE_98_length_20568_cov_1.409546.p3 type:complete len:899 gc:universal NODE_98_length_20568_cov_1.409546:4498-1802(-)